MEDPANLQALMEKISALEAKMVSKEDLDKQNKELKEEISLLKSQMVTKNDLNINVKTFEGKSVTLTVNKSDKIKDLKSQYEQKEKVPKQELFLYLDGHLLNDNLTIDECNIKGSSIIQLVKSNNNENLNYANDKIFIINALEKNLSRKIKYLLYSARKDGDDANTFHKMCDGKGELLYVITTSNNVNFGIYVSKPLFSDGQTRTDSLQMVISPSNNFAIKSKNSNATYHCNSGQGAKFHCMELNTPFLSSNCVDIQSCSDFDLPKYPSGNSQYQIKELDVYAVE